MNPSGKPETLRVAGAWFHTWAGLLLGWVMFAIFVTGTLSFYRHELTLWMRPELQAAGPGHAGTPAQALQRLRELAPQSTQWFVNLPDEREKGLRLGWRTLQPDGKPGRFETRTLDPATGQLITLRPGLAGDFFYRFHFELRSADKSRWILEGRWAVCIASMVMLAALLSGIVTHRRIFADFFTFRPGKGGQRAWLDGHNLTGVLVLPFYLVITFSGLAIFHTMFLPAGLAAAYGSNTRAYTNELVDAPAAGRPARGAGEMPPLAWVAIAEQAARLLPEGRVDTISVLREDRGVRVELRGGTHQRLTHPAPRLVFDGITGQLLARVDANRAAARTLGVLYGLHMAHFAGPLTRLALFGLGVAGSLMIATGLVLWVVKRQARPARASQATPALGLRLVDGLNIGTLAGLPLAVAVYTLATQWLTVPDAGRADGEIQCFFAAWGLALVVGLARPGRATWCGLWALNGLAYAALLGIGLKAWAWGPARPLPLWGVDLAWLLAAGAATALAWRLRPRGSAASAVAAAAPSGGTATPTRAQAQAQTQMQVQP